MKKRVFIPLSFVFLIGLTFGERFALSNALEKKSPCPQEFVELAPPGDKGYQYREKGNYCEGMLDKQVSGIESLEDILVPVSFTRGSDAVDPDEFEAIKLSWNSSLNKGTHLEAIVLDFDVLYRMDSEHGPTENFFNWPTKWIKESQYQKYPLGFLAKVNYEVKKYDRPTTIYLPLTVGPNESGEMALQYFFSISAHQQIELTRIFIKNEDGEIVKDFPKNDFQDYYSLEDIIDGKFPLKILPKSGIYELVFDFLFRGAADSHSVWFYHKKIG